MDHSARTSPPHQLPRNKDSFVVQHDLDSVELRFLAAARMLFTGLAAQGRGKTRPSSGPNADWYAACHAAEAYFPLGDPSDTIGYLVQVIEAMRALRRDTFVFSKQGCAKCCEVLSQEERLLVTTLKALRRQRHAAAYLNALLLCEGRDPAPVLVAMELFDYAVVKAEGRQGAATPDI